MDSENGACAETLLVVAELRPAGPSAGRPECGLRPAARRVAGAERSRSVINKGGAPLRARAPSRALHPQVIDSYSLATVAITGATA
ncbi:unnamed protein product [Danaus chrysippus]|uniref:(African queen) hypothetical protein n=1 Tax=Danaus chrysippus TaxID=151541 RepID=A0A8J2M956_9NEOP|nr:unnamed protein product [Danaus chrysippus]